MQTQIRLLLKKQSDQGLHCLQFWQAFCEIQSWQPTGEGEKCLQGFIQQFWEKAPVQNWEKKIDLTSKLGKINYLKHNNGSKIYPQKFFFLDCFMPRTSV